MRSESELVEQLFWMKTKKSKARCAIVNLILGKMQTHSEAASSCRYGHKLLTVLNLARTLLRDRMKHCKQKRKFQLFKKSPLKAENAFKNSRCSLLKFLRFIAFFHKIKGLTGF